MTRRILSVISFVFNGFLLLLIFILLLHTPFSPFADSFQLRTVLSGSMSPTYAVGSLIFTKETTAEALKVGDVISYQTSDDIVTHRIIKKEMKDGKPVFSTKGDNNQQADRVNVQPEQIQGKVYYSFPKIGIFFRLIQTIAGKRALLLTILNGVLLEYFLKELLKEYQQQREKNKLYLKIKENVYESHV